MKKLILCAGVALFAASLHAEFAMNPDENTLWKENWKLVENAATKAPVWSTKNAELKIAPTDNGLVLEGKGSSSVRYPLSSDYPWLCLTIDQAKRIADGYYAIFFRPVLDGIPYFNPVSKVPNGTYVINMGIGKGLKPKPVKLSMRLDLHRCRLQIREMTALKVPPCKITIAPAGTVKIGDEVTFTVETAKKAKSVDLTIWQSYGMRILSCAGKNRFMLKEVAGSNGTRWSASVKYDGFSGAVTKSKEFKPGEIIFEMTVKIADTAESFFMMNQDIFPLKAK